jgi:hypothetical protein
VPPRAPVPFQAIPVLALLRPEDRAALAPECELSAAALREIAPEK